jgi:prepilin-type N-terminal cleavage/methylation domain-containing protein
VKRGFTLIEVLGVLFILGVALALGFTAYGGFLARARLEGDARNLAQAFAAARAETKRAHTPVCVQVEREGYRLGYPCGSGTYRAFAVAQVAGNTLPLEITYVPPYGTADYGVSDTLFASVTLVHKDAPGLARDVNLVGPLGKAVVR